MIDKIMEAVSIALNNEFGDSCEIYTEQIEQDLEEPCFLISCINTTKKPFRGGRQCIQNRLCIYYFPESYKRRECNDVAERLMQCLEYITADKQMMRGIQMEYEVVDDILNFFVSYETFSVKSENNTKMETIENNTNIKEGG